jgi:hypothetical protein
MKFKQYKNGSCDIIFEDSEVEIIKNNKKMHLSDETLRHFGNTLVKIVADWNIVLREDLQKKQTEPDQIIRGEKPKDDS